jgi:hypothetical protein
VAYIDEPFRPDQRPGIFDAGIDRWFAYVPDYDEERIRVEVEKLAEFGYSLSAEIKALASVRDALRMGHDIVRFSINRMRSKRVLLKDPIAVLSSAWLASEFDIRVVVMVRHPAAFAYSLKRKGWTFPFDHLLTQRRLMEHLLEPFAGEIEKYASRPQPIIKQASLLWAVIYHSVSQFLDQHPDWILVRHEDLARNPVDEFQDLYARLELPYTTVAQRTIAESSRSENPTEPKKKAKDVQRDSRGLIGRWKSALSEQEICTIRKKTKSIANKWYNSSDWILSETWG